MNFDEFFADKTDDTTWVKLKVNKHRYGTKVAFVRTTYSSRISECYKTQTAKHHVNDLLGHNL